MKIYRSQVLVLTYACICSTSANAQTSGSATSDRLTAAQVRVVDNCYGDYALAGSVSQYQIQSANPKVAAGGASLPLAPIFAGLLGDVASAGLKGAAVALGEASRERTFGGEGVGVFEFYRIENATIGYDTTSAGCVEIVVTPTAKGKDGGPSFAGRFIVEPRDGSFVLQPVELQYLRRFPGAPSKALPVEFHAIFSIPAKGMSTPTDEPVFAVARIQLPPMRPGDILREDRLVGFSSHALPLRALPTKTPSSGSFATTSVQARIILLRNANAFGKALSEAVTARAPAAGTTVTDEASKLLSPNQYNAKDAALSVARATVDARQLDLTNATAGGDPKAIEAARVALVAAQADANVKASEAGRPLPFPALVG